MILGFILIFAIAVCCVIAAVPSCTRAPLVATPDVLTTGTVVTEAPEGQLRLMTLNLAHGRGQAGTQGFQSRTTIHGNLNAIADVLRREQPHIVAIQEADSCSWWNKRFNHAAWIADAAGFASSVVGEHLSGWGLSYGTGFISTIPLTDVRAHTFHQSKPYFAKGFTIATVSISPDQAVDVVAVHLDYARHSVRVSELCEMEEILRPRMKMRPIIVMGDFNSQWLAKRSPVRDFAERLGLSTWDPESPYLATFPSFKSRLDYILISSELEFVDHCVLADRVSDHRPVLATVRLKKTAPHAQ